MTPVTRLEFLLGKQAPYVALCMLSFLLLMALALFVFRVPFTGSLPAYASAAFHLGIEVGDAIEIAEKIDI